MPLRAACPQYYLQRAASAEDVVLLCARRGDSIVCWCKSSFRTITLPCTVRVPERGPSRCLECGPIVAQMGGNSGPNRRPKPRKVPNLGGELDQDRPLCPGIGKRWGSSVGHRGPVPSSENTGDLALHTDCVLPARCASTQKLPEGSPKGVEQVHREPRFRQKSTKFARFGTFVGRCWATLTNRWQLSTKISRCGPHVCRRPCLPSVGEHRPNWEQNQPILPASTNMWPRPDNFGGSWAETHLPMHLWHNFRASFRQLWRNCGSRRDRLGQLARACADQLFHNFRGRLILSAVLGPFKDPAITFCPLMLPGGALDRPCKIHRGREATGRKTHLGRAAGGPPVRFHRGRARVGAPFRPTAPPGAAETLHGARVGLAAMQRHEHTPGRILRRRSLAREIVARPYGCRSHLTVGQRPLMCIGLRTEGGGQEAGVEIQVGLFCSPS